MLRVLRLILALLFIAACSGEGRPKESALPELPPPIAAAQHPRGEIRPTRELVVLFSGEVRGEIEPCGCPTLPYGGFARRSAAVREAGAAGMPVFQLDAGEALVKGLRTDGRDDTADRAQLILDLMVEVGVDAMVPGPTDLRVLGADGLRALPGRGIDVVSATWADEAGNPIFPPAVVIERAGVRLGVVGLSAPADGVSARDPVLAAREALAGLPSDLTLVVAVSNLAERERARVVAEVQGLSAVLSTMGEAYDRPAPVGVPVVEVGDRGRYLTVVRVRAASAPGQPLDLSAERALRDLDAMRAQLARQVEEAKVRPQLERLEAQVRAAGEGMNLALITERPLGSDLDGPADTDALIAAFKAKQEGAAKARVAVPHGEWAPTYASSAPCVRCHSLQFARWTYTGHARATQALTERQRQRDVECIGCHSTGYGEKGGFAETDPATLRVYGDVQCEACHGPLQGHPRDARAKATPVSEETCRGCHDPANSPNFDYASYLPRVACPKDERGAVTTPPGSDPPLPAP